MNFYKSLRRLRNQVRGLPTTHVSVRLGTSDEEQISVWYGSGDEEESEETESESSDASVQSAPATFSYAEDII